MIPEEFSEEKNMERKITRAEVCALCEKASDAAREKELPQEEQMELFRDAVQGMCDYIVGTLNPVSHDEHPYIITALRLFANAIAEKDAAASTVAQGLELLIKAHGYTKDVPSVLADARRAMTGDG